MKCPIDNESLVMTERGGVEIDYCPKCRGVWLDRGELDKIIERAAQAAPVQAAPVQAAPVQQAYAQPATRPQAAPPPPPPEYRGRDDDDDYRYGYKKKRRESFLGELFDF